MDLPHAPRLHLAARGSPRAQELEDPHQVFRAVLHRRAGQRPAPPPGDRAGRTRLVGAWRGSSDPLATRPAPPGRTAAAGPPLLDAPARPAIRSRLAPQQLAVGDPHRHAGGSRHCHRAPGLRRPSIDQQSAASGAQRPQLPPPVRAPAAWDRPTARCRTTPRAEQAAACAGDRLHRLAQPHRRIRVRLSVAEFSGGFLWFFGCDGARGPAAPLARTIPAWANGPGHDPNGHKGLKARTIAPLRGRPIHCPGAKPLGRAFSPLACAGP